MNEKSFKDIVLDIKELNDFYKDKLEMDYSKMTMKQKMEFLKLSNGLRDKVIEMREIVDQIEVIEFENPE